MAIVEPFAEWGGGSSSKSVAPKNDDVSAWAAADAGSLGGSSGGGSTGSSSSSTSSYTSTTSTSNYTATAVGTGPYGFGAATTTTTTSSASDYSWTPNYTVNDNSWAAADAGSYGFAAPAETVTTTTTPTYTQNYTVSDNTWAAADAGSYGFAAPTVTAPVVTTTSTASDYGWAAADAGSYGFAAPTVTAPVVTTTSTASDYGWAAADAGSYGFAAPTVTAPVVTTTSTASDYGWAAADAGSYGFAAPTVTTPAVTSASTNNASIWAAIDGGSFGYSEPTPTVSDTTWAAIDGGSLGYVAPTSTVNNNVWATIDAGSLGTGSTVASDTKSDREIEAELTDAAADYVSLYGFIGPLAPGMTRADAEDRVRDAAIEAGLNPDQVIADLNRDAAFQNRPASSFDLTADVHTMSRSDWMDLIGDHPEIRGIYLGGGGVYGPDGELYPLVIPTVNDGDDQFNADRFPVFGDYSRSVENHLGEDTGWTTLGIDAGPVRLGDKPGGWARVAAFFAGTGGFQPLGGQPVRASGYDALNVSSSGYPTLSNGEADRPMEAGPSTLPGDPIRLNYVMVNGRLATVDAGNLHTYNRETRRAAERMGVAPAPNTRVGAAAAGADLAVTLGQGMVAALRLDDGNNGYYQLVYEQSDDGGRRAMLRTYSITSNNGEFQIWPSYVAVNENQELYGTPMSFKFPEGDSIYAPDDGFTVVQLDPRGS